MAGENEIETDLALYRVKSIERARKRTGGLRRDVSIDLAIVEAVKSNPPRSELAAKLGLTEGALAQRIRRLRHEGHDIPDARYTRRPEEATA